MGGVRKRFDHPDETRELPNAVVAGVELAGSAAAKATFQAGWRWSESVKPIVRGKNCQQHHAGYVLSGTLHVATVDWREAVDEDVASTLTADEIAGTHPTTSEPTLTRAASSSSSTGRPARALTPSSLIRNSPRCSPHRPEARTLRQPQFGNGLKPVLQV